MKKILLTLTVLCITAGVSFAYMMDEGYSEQTTVIVQKESGEYNPAPTNKWQKVGFRFWNYIDPVSPKARDEKFHSIKPYSSYEDL